MKICYIPPKTPKKKDTNIILLSGNIAYFFSALARIRDPQLVFILIVCILLAIAVCAQNVLMGNKKDNKYDKMLKDYERDNKIKKMLEDKKDKKCSNVNTNKLV